AAKANAPMRVVRRPVQRGEREPHPMATEPDYQVLDKPTVQRKRAVGDGLRDGGFQEGLLDIPAFLRRQAEKRGALTRGGRPAPGRTGRRGAASVHRLPGCGSLTRPPGRSLVPERAATRGWRRLPVASAPAKTPRSLGGIRARPHIVCP